MCVGGFGESGGVGLVWMLQSGVGGRRCGRMRSSGCKKWSNLFNYSRKVLTCCNLKLF